MAQSNYEIPEYGSAGSVLHPWLMEAVAEGDVWLKAQRPSIEWDAITKVLGPAGEADRVVGQSNTGYNKARRIYRELLASLSNFRHVGEIVPTEDDAQQLFDRAHLLTNLDRNWERVSFASGKIRDGLANAIGFGTGYIYLDWDPAAYGPGRGDIRMRSVAPWNVTFVQLPNDHDIQKAYMVLIREELPINLAKRMYAWNPTFAKDLVPDRDAPSGLQKGLERVQQFLSPFLRTSGSIRKANESFPVVDVWTVYTMDGRINEAPGPRTMGVKGTNWSYVVPALGDPLQTGTRNPRTGEMFTMPAGPDDCLMFPLRRLTVFSRTGIAYDGSSSWWHGQVPLARFRFNDLPWEALGASLIGDARSIQIGIEALIQIIEDSAAARMNPPKIYDDTRVDKAWADNFNTRKAGVVGAADLSQGSPVEFPVPPQFYDVPLWIGGEGGFIKQQEARMDYLSCVTDLVAIAKARQIPGADTLEKLLEMAGPIVQDMVNALVEPMTQLGNWRIAYLLQFYTKARMIKVADPEAVEVMQNVKYVPEALIPYIDRESQDAYTLRARSYLNDFRYDVTESGINEIHRLSRQLLYIQLTKANVLPISWWTMAKIARVPNYGPPPKGTNTEMERVLAQKNMEAEMQIELAQKIQAATGGMTPQGGGAPPVGGGEQGRPPSFSGPPKLVQKDGGTRSTIATS
jgi:hypothetical protein